MSALWREIRSLVAVAVLVLVLQTAIYRPFYIPTGSMIPTLLVGDFVFVAKYAYGWSRFSLPFWTPPVEGRLWGRTPARGDVAVFRLPRDPEQVYVKRIVGLPGDRIQIRGGVLHINGVAVERQPMVPWTGLAGEGPPVAQYREVLPGGIGHPILQPFTDGPLDETAAWDVPAGYLFAMGDNRENSLDSRVSADEGGVGLVPLDNLVGKALFQMFHIDLDTPWWAVWRWPGAISFARSLTAVR